MDHPQPAPFTTSAPPELRQALLPLDGLPGIEDWVQKVERQTVNVWLSPTKQTKLHVPLGGPPQYVIARLFQVTPGEYLLKPVSLEPYLHVRAGFCQRLGLDISDDTLFRLVEAGFIRFIRPSPQRILVSLQSLWEHLEASSKPGFWTRERRLRYLAVIDAERDRKDAKDARKKPATEEE